MGNTVDISWLALIFGFLTLLIPVYFFSKYETRLTKDTIISFSRMALQLLAVGFILKFVFEWNSMLINFTWVILMLIASSLTITRRSNLKYSFMFKPILISSIAMFIFNGLIFAFILIGYKDFLTAQYLIPLSGMIIGNSINSSVIGIRSFYKYFKTNEEEYKYFLMSGANKREALRLFMSDALRDAFTPQIASTSVMGLIWLPGMMTGQILGGTSPVIAIKYQILMMTAVFVGGVINVVLAIRLSVKSSFDEYDMLKKDVYLNK
jgi:putative ABC transport system permease protein